MKKTLLTLLFFLTTLDILFSQSENRKSLLGVSTGCSIPFAEFGYASMKPYAGFAGPGLNIETDFMLYTGRVFGFTYNIGYSSIFFREKAYKSQYDRMLPGYGQNSVSAGNYQVLKGLAGIILKIPENRHTEALLLLQLGVAMSVHPDLTVTNSELGIVNSVIRNRKWAPMSNVGLKLNYWLTEKYAISLNYNLNYTRPDFYDETSPERVFFLPVRYMNVNAGFIIKL